MLPDDVRALLVCPRCHGELGDVESGLRCEACDVVYPVEQGVPVLLIDSTRESETPAG